MCRRGVSKFVHAATTTPGTLPLWPFCSCRSNHGARLRKEHVFVACGGCSNCRLESYSQQSLSFCLELYFAWNYILPGIILILFGLIFGLWTFNYCVWSVWFHQLQTQWDSMIPAFFWKCEEFSNQPWFWRCASLQCRLCFLSSGPLAGDGVATAQTLLSETWITPPFRASTWDWLSPKRGF